VVAGSFAQSMKRGNSSMRHDTLAALEFILEAAQNIANDIAGAPLSGPCQRCERKWRAC
jgi:hypothetical protein